MASSRKSRRSSLADSVSDVLKQWVKAGDRLVVGLSGGVDSIVLLDLLDRLAPRHQFRLSALHVNHQLSPRAGEWSRFCKTLCAGRDIPFKAVKVTIARRPGESLEAAAREARYRVFARQPGEFIALAHHLDDQAETLLLQLLRGAGVKGLSAMPVCRTQDSGLGIRRSTLSTQSLVLSPQSSVLSPALLRPLLEIPRREIEAYARNRRLQWVEDESNVNTAFDRNFLRHQVLPLVEKRFPAYRATLIRASENLAEAASLLDELARMDSRSAVAGGLLRLDALRKLSPSRAKNLLRFYLAGRQVPMPSSKRLEEMLRQLTEARDDSRVRVKLGEVEIRRYQGALHVQRTRALPRAGFSKPWGGGSRLEIDELGGTLVFRRVKGSGISLIKLMAAPVTVRMRQGGERLRPDCKRPRRSLKNLLQETGIPPWEREALPLLFSGDTLVWVPGIGIDCDFQAQGDEQGLAPEWGLDGT